SICDSFSFEAEILSSAAMGARRYRLAARQSTGCCLAETLEEGREGEVGPRDQGVELRAEAPAGGELVAGGGPAEIGDVVGGGGRRDHLAEGADVGRAHVDEHRAL